MRASRCILPASALLSICLLASPSFAVDRFEIQVYEADVNRPGQLALELHTNYTLQGTRTPSYEGEIAPNHVGRMTLEPALGLTEWLELGAYLQTLVAPDEGARWAGWKGRLKFVIPTRLTAPWFLGINMELGRVPRAVEEQGWANEFRPILGFNNGHWLFDINPIFGYALTGADKFKKDFEPAGKIAWNTQKGFSVGVEYYAGLGLLRNGFDPWSKQEHLLFGVFDLAHPAGASDDEEGEWELNVGLGRALTQADGPKWLVKTIVGRAF
ncbi:MAG: hypothetical protein HY898_00170 [Deltaproteobacteria bacterium]|nr:hypothetical protein [Deltaproteobacteria bacterium]